MNRTFIVGDVHGCIVELRELLYDVTPSDRVVFVGDLVDKGPCSVEVVQYYLELRARCTTHLIMGNHEETHLRWLSRKLRDDAPGMERMRSHAECSSIYESLDPLQAQALFQSALPALALPEFGLVAVHAGIPKQLEAIPAIPGTAHLPPDERKIVEQLYRIRYVDDEGDYVSLSAVEHDLRFWTETYDGRFGHVVYGHQPYPRASEPVVSQYATGIDLGCVYGGHLCALVCVEKRIETRMVRAHQVYMEPFDLITYLKDRNQVKKSKALKDR
jgi:serine/threonine protein phosphatase 1